MTHSDDAAPTRWLLLAVFLLSSAINYLDRQSLATLAPLVRAEFHLSNAATALTGTIADARLSANVALLNANQAFTGANRFAGVVTLTNAGNLLSGTGTVSGNGAATPYSRASASLNSVGPATVTRAGATVHEQLRQHQSRRARTEHEHLRARS